MITIPFSGTKRYSYKNVKTIAEDGGYKKVFEPFGGSCVLTLNLVNDGIVKEGIANDYDHYFDEYETYLDLKDKVVEEGYKRGLRRYVSTNGTNYREDLDGTRTEMKSRILPHNEIEILQDIIDKNVPERYWRYFATGTNFMFSSCCSHKKLYLSDFKMFSAYLKTDKQRDYLKKLNTIITLEHLDYRDFLDKYKDDLQDSTDSLLILDPPYMGVRQGQYGYQFTYDDTLSLIQAAKDLNCDFIFFNHDKQEVEEWLEGTDCEIFSTGCANNSCTRNRLDVMAFVKRGNNE